MAWVKIVQPSEATGELKQVYDELLRTQTRVPEVTGILSLEPGALRRVLIGGPGSNYGCTSLEPARAEMIATAVSAINRCRY